MNANIAILKGYSHEVRLVLPEFELNILVKPVSNLHDGFKYFDLDENKFAHWDARLKPFKIQYIKDHKIFKSP